MGLSTKRFPDTILHRISGVSLRQALVFALVAAMMLGSGGCGSRKPARPAGREIERAAQSPAAGEQAPGSAVQENAAQTEKQPQAPQPPPDPGPMIEINQKGISLRWIEKGIIKMKATAREGQVNELTKIGVLTDFSAELYEDGKLTTTMVAPRVVADTAKQLVTATGGVTLKSLDRSTVVRSDWVKWYARHQMMIGNGGVNIKSDTWDVNSAAFVADTALKTLTVKNSAKGLAPE